jgi:hypothetical protein
MYKINATSFLFVVYAITNEQDGRMYYIHIHILALMLIIHVVFSCGLVIMKV